MPYTPRIPANVRRLINNAQQNAAIDAERETQLFDLEVRKRNLQIDDIQHETEVMNPLREREARIRMQQQREEARMQAIENELESKKLQNAQAGYDEAAAMRNTFYQLSPEEREANRSRFAEDARKLFNKNPNDYTRSALLQFGSYDVQNEIRLATAPSGYGGVDALGNPLISQDENYRDSLDRLQDLKRKYWDVPELHQPIAAAIEQEMNKPQNWASQYDAYFGDLGHNAQRILNKAKAGKVITQMERDLVQASLDRHLNPKTSASSFRAPSSDVFTKYYNPDTPEGYRRAVRSAYPHVDWDGGVEKSPAPKMEAVETVTAAPDEEIISMNIQPEDSTGVPDPGKGGSEYRDTARGYQSEKEESKKLEENEAIKFLEDVGVIDMQSTFIPDWQTVGSAAASIRDALTTDNGEKRLGALDQVIDYYERQLDSGAGGAASKLNRLYEERDRLRESNGESVTESITRLPGRAQTAALQFARDTGLIKFLARITGDRRYDDEGNIKPVYWDRKTGKLKPVPDAQVKEGYGLLYMEDGNGNLVPWVDDEILERRDKAKSS
jgi:hypothetical protein